MRTNFRDIHAFQTAEIARVAAVRRNEALQAATFTAADYGKRYRYADGQVGTLRQRFLHYPDNGTAVFQPILSEDWDSAAFAVTPDEVTPL
jgi:hypothetical protein